MAILDAPVLLPHTPSADRDQPHDAAMQNRKG
jgi:hypothetical protein